MPVFPKCTVHFCTNGWKKTNYLHINIVSAKGAQQGLKHFNEKKYINLKSKILLKFSG